MELVHEESERESERHALDERDDRREGEVEVVAPEGQPQRRADAAHQDVDERVPGCRVGQGRAGGPGDQARQSDDEQR